jgi:hypothetical protein
MTTRPKIDVSMLSSDGELCILTKQSRAWPQYCEQLDADALLLQLELEGDEGRRKLELLLLREHAETLAAILLQGLARLPRTDAAGAEPDTDEERTH